MKALALVLALAGVAALTAPVASYAKIDQNANYYRSEDRVRYTSGDPKEEMRQAACQQRGSCDSDNSPAPARQ
ncbi:hypothetical protein H3V53_01785 [Paraburkholderia bengalensis]|uniref:Uncharacterized protein n=1 Tax=Paraburkholderia bengalensis TaxID=2747562 RepID=A0ABU8IK66_9BURK